MGWKNESPPVFYTTSSPSGPLPCFLSLQFTIMQSWATGIADHILPLGDLFGVIRASFAVWEACFEVLGRGGRTDFGSERSDLRYERPDLGSERPDLGSERPDLGSERSDLGS